MFMNRENLVAELSLEFAVRIVNFNKYLKQNQKEFVISSQILRSGTSIGANIAESQMAQSTPDFISKLHIALKEASETKYWLDLLLRTRYVTDEQYRSLNKDLRVIIGLLVNIVKKVKGEDKTSLNEL